MFMEDVWDLEEVRWMFILYCLSVQFSPRENWGITATVLYDRPPQQVKANVSFSGGFR